MRKLITKDNRTGFVINSGYVAISKVDNREFEISIHGINESDFKDLIRLGEGKQRKAGPIVWVEINGVPLYKE